MALPGRPDQPVLFVEGEPRKPRWGGIVVLLVVIGVGGITAAQVWDGGSRATRSTPLPLTERPMPPPATARPDSAAPRTGAAASGADSLVEAARALPPPPDSMPRHQDVAASGAPQVDAESSGDSPVAEANAPAAPEVKHSSSVSGARASSPERRRPPPVPRQTELAPRPTAEPMPVIPGRLYVSSRPWGQIYLDGRLVGDTPATALPVAPGIHILRVEREGYRPFVRQILVVADQELRFIDLELQEMPR